MKKIPYGIDEFDRIITQDYYYIDKTRYIPTVENRNSFILLVRPRRMGKSLFTNMMMSYYDIAKKDCFDRLFGNLWIGAHPTQFANSFLVLKFDFSKVTYHNTSLEGNFNEYCLECIRNFLDYYDTYFTEQDKATVLKRVNAKDAVNTLVNVTKLKHLSIYLFIDEYDNFANIVLASRGVDAHARITHGEGFYRDFFKALKGSFERIYMTGVTPVTYDDLTSGFSIADVVALNPNFNHVIGVTHTDLREMIEYYRSVGAVIDDTDKIISEMKPWYDNFCFAEDCYDTQPTVYNTDMVLRYMREMIEHRRAPKDMIDRAARTDTNKLDYLVLTDDLKNRELRIEIIREICAKGYTTGEIKEEFSASEVGDESNFKSMLYYYGTLTFGGWDDYGVPILQVPNKTMGELYLTYLQHIIDESDPTFATKRKDLDIKIREAAVSGDWQPMVNAVASLYYDYSSLRDSIRGEADIQGFVRGLLCLNNYFDIWPELELGHGYCDVLLIPKGSQRCPTKHSYLIELKYMKANETNVDRYVDEAQRQLDTYVADWHLQSSPLLRGTDLSKIYLVFRGQELVRYGIA